jgi:putative sigma-54 modulation protein
MKVFTQSVNFNADKDLIKYVEKKANQLVKFHDKIVDAEVFLKVQNTSDKENKIIEIKLNIPGSKKIERKIKRFIDSIKR